MSVSPSAPPSPESRPKELIAHPMNPAVRTSDQERQQVVERLHDALGEGRLDLDETEVRVGAAYAARYRADLTPLLADLPEGPVSFRDAPAEGAPAWSALWTFTVWRARVAVLGARAQAPPTRAHQRSAALLILLAFTWFAACAVLGAAMVAA